MINDKILITIKSPVDRVRTILRVGLVRVVLVAVATITCAPVAFMIFKSLTKQDGSNTFTFAPWNKVLSGDLPNAALISLIVCSGSLVLILTLSTLAAFSFAKLPFKGSQLVLAIIVVMVLVPLQTYLITEYFNYSSLDLIGNIPAVCLLYAATQIPFSTFIITNFYRAIPDELLEAAIVEGASYPRAFWSVFLPMAKPAMVTVGVLGFIGIWNDVLLALLFLPTPGQRTLSVVMASSLNGRVFDVSALMAGSLLTAIPCLVIYLIFERHITAGLTAGTGK